MGYRHTCPHHIHVTHVRSASRPQPVGHASSLSHSIMPRSSVPSGFRSGIDACHLLRSLQIMQRIDVAASSALSLHRIGDGIRTRSRVLHPHKTTPSGRRHARLRCHGIVGSQRSRARDASQVHLPWRPNRAQGVEPGLCPRLTVEQARKLLLQTQPTECSCAPSPGESHAGILR